MTGGSLKIQFKGPAGLVGLCAACATWLDAAVSGDVTITLVTAGGVDEAPDAAALSPERTAGGSGVYRGWYVAAVAAVLLSVVGASGWYLKRRRSE